MQRYQNYRPPPNVDASNEHRGIMSAADHRRLWTYPKTLLSFDASADITTGTTLSANVWVNYYSTTLNVDGPNGRVLWVVRQSIVASHALGATAPTFKARVKIDGVQHGMLSAVTLPQQGTAMANVVGTLGGGSFLIEGLAAGSHTFALDFVSNVTNTVVYLRPGTQYGQEFLEYDLIQLSAE